MQLRHLLLPISLLGIFVGNPANGQIALPPGTPSTPDASDFAVAVTAPIRLLYLQVEAVRADLNLTKDQFDKLNQIEKEWSAAAKKADLGDVDRAALRERLTKGVSKEMDGILTANQKMRLQQIMVRHRLKEYGAYAVLPGLARDLELTAEQRDKHERIYSKRAECVLESLTGGERLPSIRRKVHEANAEYREQFEQMLTKPQQAKFATMLGEPFAPEIALGAPMALNLVMQPSVYAKEFFNLYSFEPEFLANEAVQTELGLSEGQRHKARKFWFDWDERLGLEIKARKSNFNFAQESPREMNIAAIRSAHDFVRHGLRNIMHPAQEQRFRQIMAQHRLKKAGIAGVCGLPDFADSINLKESQVAALQNTSNPREVFSPPQWDAFQTNLGLAFKADVTFNDRGVFTYAQSKTAGVAKKSPPPVDLKTNSLAGFILVNGRLLDLKANQTARLKELAEDSLKIREILHKELSNLPPPAELGGARMNLPEVRAQEIVRKAIHEQCLELLDKRQQSLLKANLPSAPVPLDP